MGKYRTLIAVLTSLGCALLSYLATTHVISLPTWLYALCIILGAPWELAIMVAAIILLIAIAIAKFAWWLILAIIGSFS